MKRILITLLALALVATLFVSCNGDAAASTPDPLETVSVENFLKSYYAADFIESTVSIIPGVVNASELTAGTTTTKTISKDKDSENIKNDLTFGFQDKNNEKRFCLTEVTAAEGTVEYLRTDMGSETVLKVTTEVENCKIDFKYINQTSTDDGKNWSNVDTNALDGYLVCSTKLVEEDNFNLTAKTGTSSTKYSNITINVEINEDGEVTNVSKSTATSYKDIEYVFGMTIDDQGISSYTSLDSAKYNGVALSEADVKILEPILLGK